MTPPDNRTLLPRTARPGLPGYPGGARRPPAAHRAAPVGPSAVGTGLLLCSLVVSYYVASGGVLGSRLAHTAAIVVGIGLLLSMAPDMTKGMSHLVRADLFALLSFYFLTLFEFLIPQPNFDTLVTASATARALFICYCAFAGLAIGRHFVTRRPQPFRRLLTTPVSPERIMGIFLCCALVGYLHMLVAVKFNLFDLVDAFVAPRFSQPWSRGRLGDWKALFEELGMLLYLVPPTAGIILARRNQYRPFQLLLVAAILLFTLFYGYSSGTRNIFDSYLVTFLIGYAFATRKDRRHEILYIGGICAVLLIISTVTMVKFREVGLKDYLSGAADVDQPHETESMLCVDLNLFPMSRIAEVFPDHHPYLGFEMIYLGLIRPIPRAIWKGKPEGLTVSIEDMVGADGWTVAASFAGEAYMCGGFLLVFLIAAAFGWIAAWWNLLVSDDNSQLGWLIYGSGFFSVVISMRSMLVFTTALLPTLAAFALAAYMIGKGADRVQLVLPGRQRNAPARLKGIAATPRR